MKYFWMRFVLRCLCVVCVALPASAGNSQAPAAYGARLSGYTYPFAVDAFRFESQGQELAMTYMYLPPKEPGGPVVTLLHGKNFNGAYWAQTAEYLQTLGYGVLMPDQIGFGKSSKPVHYQYSFAALASNTRALMKELGIGETVVVGHSMGGMLASRFALLYPQATRELVLVNPIGLENYLHYVQYKDVAFFYQQELNKTPEKIVAYQKANYYDGAWNDNYVELTEPLRGWVRGPDWGQLAKVSALTYDMIFTQPVIEEFKDFQVPVSMILGTRDTTGPGRNWKKPGVTFELGQYDTFAERVKQRNPRIDVTELEGLGHLPHIEDFARFRQAFGSVLGRE